jgi:hypothetical protein
MTSPQRAASIFRLRLSTEISRSDTAIEAEFHFSVHARTMTAPRPSNSDDPSLSQSDHRVFATPKSPVPPALAIQNCHGLESPRFLINHIHIFRTAVQSHQRCILTRHIRSLASGCIQPILSTQLYTKTSNNAQR